MLIELVEDLSRQKIENLFVRNFYLFYQVWEFGFCFMEESVYICFQVYYKYKYGFYVIEGIYLMQSLFLVCKSVI